MAHRLMPYCMLLLFASACAKPGASGQPGVARDKGALLKEAREQYNTDTASPLTKDDDQAPIPDGYAVRDLQASAFKMKKKLLHGSDHDWVGAIRTNMPYSPMGLGVGMNYIFRLPVSDPDHELVVVPEDTNVPAHYLRYDRYLDLTGGHRGPPLLIRKSVKVGVRDVATAIGGCIECSIGHCSTIVAGDPY